MSVYLCPRCGKTMTVEQQDVLEDYGETVETYVFVCGECGMEFEASVPENKSEPQAISDQGFGQCPFCGGYLAWCADFMRSEVTGEELSENEDSLVQECHCPQCGASITAFYPKEEFTDD